jgi:hypothetical protein
MIPLIAIPVIHSSGAFIASSATGYLAGTLSSTWLGAFVIGNAGLLAGASALTASAIGVVFTGVKSSVTGLEAEKNVKNPDSRLSAHSCLFAYGKCTAITAVRRSLLHRFLKY